MVIEYDLAVQIQNWPEEWMTSLKISGDSSTKGKEFDTLQHGKASGKDKEKDEHESEEEDKHDEGQQDPPEGDELTKETEKEEIEKKIVEKRKAEGEATSKKKKKQKVNKTKDIVVLNQGYSDQFRDKIQEATIESQNKVKDH